MIPAQPPRPARRRRRRVFLGIVLMLLAVAIGGGIYTYRLVDKVVNAENAAVVPLPTRSTNFGSTNPTATPTTASATKTPVAPATTTAKSATLTTDGTVAASSTPVPTVTPASTETASATVDPNATATVDPYKPLPTADGVSHLDVLSDLWSAVSADDPSTSSVWGGKTDINLLLLGIDRRAAGGDQNADVIMIVHVDLVNSKVSAVSIPRDLLVDIPGVGPGKINGAYNDGYQADPTNKAAGVAKMRDTIESVFQVPIDGYVLVDFDGFVNVVDQMGGLDINVPTLIIDNDYPTDNFGTETVTFVPGMQHMDGESALKYVRTRHQDTDDGRRERQIQVLRAMFAKAKSIDSLTNGFKLIDTLGSTVQTSFSTKQQLTLAKLGYAMQDGDIYTASLVPPLISQGYTADGAWVYQGDPDQIRAWVQANLMTNPQPSASGTPSSATSNEFSGDSTPTPIPGTPGAWLDPNRQT